MSAMCGTSVPDWLGHLFDGPDDDPEIRRMVAAVVAAEQVRLLQANGVDEFHFYTLNRPDLTYAIAHILGVRRSGRADGPGLLGCQLLVANPCCRPRRLPMRNICSS